MRGGWRLGMTGAVAMAGLGCHPAPSSGNAVTPAVGTLAPATLVATPDADGVSTDLTVTETYEGTTYGGASDAFILTVQVLVDGAIVASVPAEYLISSGSPGDGIYGTTFTLSLGQLATGSHTLSVQVLSPADFAGTNASAASLTITVPLPVT